MAFTNSSAPLYFIEASLFMKSNELIPNLFKTEFRKITSVLCKSFGIAYIEDAENIVSETFESALQIWTYKGIPENPTGWLYTVAKNKAKNYLVRRQLFSEKIVDQIRYSESEHPKQEIDLSEQNITDSQLQMLFAICNPSIPVEAQIGLALRILCGFGIEEIANAFLTNKETINKRLFRAKEKLRLERVRIEFPAESEINKRLATVLTTLYLFYNEGYYSESQEPVLREDLCFEAMRLVYLLIENERTNLPQVNALLALMCFQSSRFPARKNESGEIILYEDQDESLWDYGLISKGAYHLHLSSQGNFISRYHLEASIAYWYTIKNDTMEKWENILQLYNKLLQIEYSPIAALNRTYALSKANGTTAAIREAEKLQLVENPYYYTLLGELYKDIDGEKARLHFQKAIALVRTEREKDTILKKLSMF
jgi:RNA polymerase sigma factor (sigma-70 family)